MRLYDSQLAEAQKAMESLQIMAVKMGKSVEKNLNTEVAVAKKDLKGQVSDIISMKDHAQDLLAEAVTLTTKASQVQSDGLSRKTAWFQAFVQSRAAKSDTRAEGY